jgi:hypothetical protein
MIALIEHIFTQEFLMHQVALALQARGTVVITTPTPLGNEVVHRLGPAGGLFDQSALDDHIVLSNRHRFRLLAAEIGLKLVYHKYFQFHCNQLAILAKSTP